MESGCTAAFANFQVQWPVNLLRQAANWGYLPHAPVRDQALAQRCRALSSRGPQG